MDHHQGDHGRYPQARGHIMTSIAALALAVTVTAYSPDVPTGATGEPVMEGLTCAVSRDLDHLVGKWVYLEGFGWRYVNDRTDRRWTLRVDIVINDEDEAMEHGKQKTVLKGMP